MMKFILVKLKTYCFQIATPLKKASPQILRGIFTEKQLSSKENFVKKVCGEQAFQISCGLVVHRRQFHRKIELMLDFSVEELKILICSQENHLGGGFFSVNLQIQSLFLRFNQKRTPPKTFFPHEFCKIVLSQFRKILCDISLPNICHNRLAGLQSLYVAILQKIRCLAKIYRTTP